MQPWIKEIARVRDKINEADRRVVNAMADRNHYPLDTEVYRNVNQKALRDLGYDPVLLDPLYLPVIEEVCEFGDMYLIPELVSVDIKLQRAIESRFLLGHDVAKVKDRRGLPINDPQREDAVIGRVAEMGSELGLDPHEVARAYRKIIDYTKAVQRCHMAANGSCDSRPLDSVTLGIAEHVPFFRTVLEDKARRMFGPNWNDSYAIRKVGKNGRTVLELVEV